LNQSLHGLYDPVLNEEVPPELSRSAKTLTAAPSTGRMATQFMHQDSTGNRVTLYFRRVDWVLEPPSYQ